MTVRARPLDPEKAIAPMLLVASRVHRGFTTFLLITTIPNGATKLLLLSVSEGGDCHLVASEGSDCHFITHPRHGRPICGAVPAAMAHGPGPLPSP